MELPNPITRPFLIKQIKKRRFTKLTPTLTHCILTLQNGFLITGESACADPANYDKAIGESIAYENALNKTWFLYGFMLKQQLYVQSQEAK